jgi:SP family sugar:H+ symporter-like MFS transporter
MLPILESLSHPSQWPLYTDMTRKAWIVAFVSAFGAMIFGYDTSFWSSVLGLDSFNKAYGDYDAATDSWAISAPLVSAGKHIQSYPVFSKVSNNE